MKDVTPSCLVVLLLAALAFSYCDAKSHFWSPKRPQTSVTPQEAAHQLLDALHNPFSRYMQDMTKFRSKAAAAKTCETHYVPLTYTETDAVLRSNISLSVCKFPYAGFGTAQRQVWLIPGGPGETSAALEPIAPTVAADYEADVYTVDFRGVGLSRPEFTCISALKDYGITQGSPAAAWAACDREVRTNSMMGMLQYEEKWMRQFSTANAARDYDQVIRRVNSKPGAPRQEIWLAGYSYGTMLVNRIVSMFPNLATHVIFDGIMFGPEARTIFTDYDLAQDAVFKKLFEACAADSFCSSKIPSPTFGVDVMRRVAAERHCAKFTTDLVSIDAFRVSLRYIGIQNFAVREMLPMLMYRLNRCDDKLDGAFLTKISKTFSSVYDSIAVKNPAPLTAQSSRNLVLGSYIQINENIDTVTPVDELLSRFSDSPLGNGLSITSYRNNIYPQFSGRYTDPDLAVLGGNGPTTLKAVIFINGEWDSQTPPHIGQNRFKDAYLNVSDRYEFTVPMKAHINSLPDRPHPCAVNVVRQFVISHGSAASTARYQNSTYFCTEPYFDWNAKLLQRTQLGYALGVYDLSEYWDGSLPDNGNSNPSGGLPLYIIIIIVVAAIVIVAIVIIGVIVYFMRKGKVSQSVVVGRGEAPYSALQESLVGSEP
eukprot:TRINITY_DN5618_c0_g2_i1.p1 TRINITY_DN5618_c0_g2~~TRINITY_DN5618_c0_g2_i1.p1  ORF type:complete len:661 (+),score=96.87 TRINITY_DN5618_c0_g2_i1:26-1984(+)